MNCLLTRTDLCELFRISPSSLDRQINEGTIPKPDIQIGRRSPRWTQESIEQVIWPNRHGH